METNVEASVVFNKLTSRIAQLEYDKAILEAVNEQNQLRISALESQLGQGAPAIAAPQEWESVPQEHAVE